MERERKRRKEEGRGESNGQVVEVVEWMLLMNKKDLRERAAVETKWSSVEGSEVVRGGQR